MGRKGGITGDGVGEQLEREKGRRVRDARKEEAKLGRKKTVRREAGSGGKKEGEQGIGKKVWLGQNQVEITKEEEFC